MRRAEPEAGGYLVRELLTATPQVMADFVGS